MHRESSETVAFALVRESTSEMPHPSALRPETMLMRITSPSLRGETVRWICGGARLLSTCLRIEMRISLTTLRFRCCATTRRSTEPQSSTHRFCRSSRLSGGASSSATCITRNAPCATARALSSKLPADEPKFGSRSDSSARWSAIGLAVAAGSILASSAAPTAPSWCCEPSSMCRTCTSYAPPRHAAGTRSSYASRSLATPRPFRSSTTGTGRANGSCTITSSDGCLASGLAHRK